VKLFYKGIRPAINDGLSVSRVFAWGLADVKIVRELEGEGWAEIAGFDTTGHTLSWTLYLLSQHPEVEAKVAAELAKHGLLATPDNPSPPPVQWSDLGKLTYMNAVIKVPGNKRRFSGLWKFKDWPCVYTPSGSIGRIKFWRYGP
jgi:Cytochrome P450